MTKEKIEEIVRSIIDDIVPIEIDDKNKDDFDDIKIDCLDKVEIAMEIEYRFNINIPDEDWNNINSISQTVEFINGIINNVQDKNKAS